MRTTLPVAAALLVLATASMPALADRDALWHILDTTCVPSARAAALPAPCARIALPADGHTGWVLMKDRRGALQYLLLPTSRISGIESPALLSADAPNFFAAAWRSRDLLDRRRGQPLPRDVVSLTLNPIRRRSQDQLHIHISCVRAELRERLAAVQADISPAWSPLPGGWLNHPWLVRRVDAETLDGIDPVGDVAAHVPGAAGNMGVVGISVVGMTFPDARPGFVLMATHWDAGDVTSGSAEHDVQDHDCAVLGDKRPRDAAELALPREDD